MVETERLIIKPLTHKQLLKYMRADNSLEAELNLKSAARTISTELKDAMEHTILPNVRYKQKLFVFNSLDNHIKS